MTTREEDKELVLRENYRDVMRSGAGQAVIWDLLNKCDVYEDIAPNDPYKDARLGRRAVGLQLLQTLQDLDSNFYPKLIMQMSEV